MLIDKLFPSTSSVASSRMCWGVYNCFEYVEVSQVFYFVLYTLLKQINCQIVATKLPLKAKLHSSCIKELVSESKFSKCWSWAFLSFDTTSVETTT